MLKRLIEVALPLKEVSEHSAREKSIRTGHISTLHIWWARRPLAACRAVAFASLIPDPDDPECPPHFRTLVMEVLSRNEFTPKNGDGATAEDTPRNRCLEFIKHFVKWEHSNNAEYLHPARKLIAVAHKFLNPGAGGNPPRVLDPFAGGGAIPLEALRLGCEADAVDLNPVAHMIELCTLVYPQKYGKPDSRPVPTYIKRLIAHNKAKKNAKGEQGLFDSGEAAPAMDDAIIPNVEITEAQYRKNPLAADVRYWGHWILEDVMRNIAHFYPQSAAGVPLAYLWARTVACQNPQCRATVPLIRQLWLCKKPKRKKALRLVLDRDTRQCRFHVVEGDAIDFNPDFGTMRQGKASCPFCEAVLDAKYLRDECKAGRMQQILLAVVSAKKKQKGRFYCFPTQIEQTVTSDSATMLEALTRDDPSIIPTESIPLYDPRRVSPPLYGISRFSDLFNRRQLLALVTFVKAVRRVVSILASTDHEYATAVGGYLALAVDRLAENSSTMCRWNPSAEKLQGTFGRQALPFVWDYCESSPFGGAVGSWDSLVANQINGFQHSVFLTPSAAHISQGSADALPMADSTCDIVLTDPPYYDAVPYSALSDFFYVWLKRTVGDLVPAAFRTPLTPKRQEIVEQRRHKLLKDRKDSRAYEEMMAKAFSEMCRVMREDGLLCVMFAHKTTAAWETLISALFKSQFVVCSSWPIHTEMKTRMVAMGTAALASSVTLVCRKRPHDAGTALWDDVRQDLQSVAQERLDFFWNQRIRGADFFISAIGPALSVYGKYERVTKLSGEEVTVGQFLDEVRSLVSNYALAKILKTKHKGIIDPESQFYVVWKWSYADAKVPADESFKLSQALRLNSESLWDKTGVLEKSSENVQAMPVSKRIKIKNLGEPTTDGAPASLIDVLHRMCAFREKNDTPGMVEFLSRSGQANNHSLWLVAQAVSEILPDGDKEKQLMQGLLNQKDGLEEAAREKKLF